MAVEEIKKKPRDCTLLLFVVALIVMVIVGGFVFSYVSDSQFMRAKERTMGEIHGMNASPDYIRGWVDALNRVDAWYHASENATT